MCCLCCTICMKCIYVVEIICASVVITCSYGLTFILKSICVSTRTLNLRLSDNYHCTFVCLVFYALHRTPAPYPGPTGSNGCGWNRINVQHETFSFLGNPKAVYLLSLPYYQEIVSSLKYVSKRWLSFTQYKMQENFLFQWARSKFQCWLIACG